MNKGIGELKSKSEDYRLAYLLMVHKNPKQVRRLVERLNNQACAFWIQVDLKSDIKLFQNEFRNFSNVFFVGNRRDGGWGSYSFVDGNIEGIKWIEASGYAYDHLVILSGQDYLLCSNENLIQTLSTNRTSSFIHYTEVTPQLNPHVRDRVSKYHIHIPFKKKIVYPYDSENIGKNVINKLMRATGKFPLPRIIPGNRQLYFGSNWIRLSRQAVKYFLNTLEREPQIIDFFKYTTLAEEHIFQTVILSGDEKERGPIMNTNFTFCHWKRAPELYTVPLNMSDLTLILSTGDLLARKFDENFDSQILDYLDKKFS